MIPISEAGVEQVVLTRLPAPDIAPEATSLKDTHDRRQIEQWP